jgi:glycosyltransferase involved in cell wall biosynthesis
VEARILLVNTRYRPPHFRGGVERYVHMIALELLKAGIPCEVIALAEPLSCETSVPHRFIRVPRLPFLIPAVFGWLGRSLWQQARVVVVQYPPFGLFVPKEKLICTVLTTGYGEAAALKSMNGFKVWGKRLRRFLVMPFERFVLRRARQLIAISEPVARELREVYGVAPERIEIVPNGVDCEAFQPSSQSKGRIPLRVLYVGRLVKRKNVDVLVAALAAARQPLQLRIVGTGPEESQLRTLVTQHALSASVEFRGFRAGRELADEYHWADVFAIPSSYEGVPLAALEAKASGLAVVAAGFAGAERLVSTRSGVLVEDGSAAGFAQALDRLASQPLDVQRMSERARIEAVEKFSWSAAVGRLIRIYQEAL